MPPVSKIHSSACTTTIPFLLMRSTLLLTLTTGFLHITITWELFCFFKQSLRAQIAPFCTLPWLKKSSTCEFCPSTAAGVRRPRVRRHARASPTTGQQSERWRYHQSRAIALACVQTTPHSYIIDPEPPPLTRRIRTALRNRARLPAVDAHALF